MGNKKLCFVSSIQDVVVKWNFTLFLREILKRVFDWNEAINNHIQIYKVGEEVE
jgi:hypothetical protein